MKKISHKNIAVYFIFIAVISIIAIYPASIFADTKVGNKVVPFSLLDVSRLALENNFDIQIAKYDAYIKRNDFLEAVSIFDTILTAKASFKDDQLVKNSSLQGSKALTNKYSVSLSKLLPTGTTVSLDLSDTRSSTNSSSVTVNPSHEANGKIAIVQSLGKNFFGLSDRRQIKIVKKDIENSDWTSLEKIETSLAQVQKTYWKVVLLTWQLDIKRDIYEKAKQLKDVYRKKMVFGLAEDPDFLAAEANLLQRQNDVLSAIDILNASKDDLLFLLNEDSRSVRIKPLDFLSLDASAVNFDSSLNLAINNRKDYKKAKNNIDKQRLSIVVKKNSLWPEIDIEASFSRNGLSGEYKEALKEIYKEDNPELFVGATIKIPIENRAARGQYNKAKLEDARALFELKKIERMILTEINNIVTRLNIQLGRVLTQKKLVNLHDQKLEAESLRFKFGRSSSDIMIRYQEDLLSAKLAYAQSLFDYKSSMIDLKLSQSTLLKEYWEGEL